LIGLCAVGAAVLIGRNGLQSRHAFLYEAVPLLLVPPALWLFFSERYEVTLAVLLLYLGLLDGAVKLASGSSVATLGRDLLLYAIVAGATVRMVLRKTPVTLPVFTGFVLAWVAVCLMQVANPANVSLVHAVTSLRQHIEFVPLFFFGYLVLRSKRRLGGLLLLLVIVAALNGIANVIETGLTPNQIASWGPGYARFALGTAESVSRTFTTAAGVVKVRPLGLGGEDGFGGLLCMIALPAAIALLWNVRRAAKLSWLLVPAAGLVLVGIVSSQERVVVVGSVVVCGVFLGLTLTSRRLIGAVSVAILVGFAAYFIGASFLASNANRYASITPNRLVSSISSSRGISLATMPTYFTEYPLGAGLGSVGPAAGSGFGTPAATSLNGENEINFLLVETGIPGLLVMIAFTLVVIRAGLALRRVRDPELQRSLMALTAVLIALLVIWFDAPVTADSPSAPFIWMSAGCLAYWYAELRSGRLPTRARRIQAALEFR
jgi:hypothetical protein